MVLARPTTHARPNLSPVTSLVGLVAAAPTGTGPRAVVLVLGLAGALIVALVLAEVIAAVVRVVGRRTRLADTLSRRARLPLRVVLVVGAVWIALRVVSDPPPEGPGWRPGVEHALLIALIIGTAWLIGALAFVAEEAALVRYRTDGRDDVRVRRARTQVMVLRRVTIVGLVVCAIAAVLLTFDAARTAGATLLASAGLLSVVVGLAAQSSLGNAFAGLQLAFTDAIRVDDVVVVEGEWGRIEEITMTYVVVHLWDDRRLIMPSLWFTTTPFQNWTRRAADLLGTVELDVDWTVPVPQVRAELTRLLQTSGLWDHRVGVLQVTDATGGVVRLRALASAEDAPTLFDLRCHVREGLVDWLRRNHPGALPHTRWEPVDSGTSEQPALPPLPGADRATAPTAVGPGETPATGSQLPAPGPEETIRLDAGRDSRLFTGSLQAVQRSRAFTGPGEDVIAEREETAEGPVVDGGEPPRG